MPNRKTLDRRSFMAGIGSAGIMAASVLTGCAPNGSSTKQSSEASKSGQWDKTVDVLIAGSGCGMYAALVAAHEGATVCVLEKSSLIGGTTALSGNMCWVPNNAHMESEGVTERQESDIVAYLKNADTYDNADSMLLEHYVKHARNTFAYLESELNFKMAVRMSLPLRGDYYDLPGALEQGRSMDFLNDEGKPGGSKTFETIVLPKANEAGVEVLEETRIVKLITDDLGGVIGALAENKRKETIRIKAEKGVILATGGFDWNKEMVKSFQRGPLFISVGVPTNTGDGHLAGMTVGAGLANMQNSWGVQAIITSNDGEYSKISDWGSYRSKPNSIMVNRRGRRFTNEAASYSTCNPSFYAYDAATCSYLNLPAYLICDQTYVDFYGFPGQKTKEGEQSIQPEYVKKYETLEELASAHSIDSQGLIDEIQRFNTFAREGKDPDWHRGEWAFDTKSNGDTANIQPNLANSCLGPVEKAPFYCTEIGPGCCGTSGGLLVNENAQVLQAANREPIGNLYALGNCSASLFGSAYPGSGATVGAGIFQGLMAVQHALGYKKY